MNELEQRKEVRQMEVENMHCRDRRERKNLSNWNKMKVKSWE